MFERELNKILLDNNRSKIELQLNIGYYRCMCRIKNTRYLPIDINRRCFNHIWKDTLCSLHYDNDKLGRVNCYPNKKIIGEYKNNLKLLNLNHNPFYSLNLKKKKKEG